VSNKIKMQEALSAFKKMQVLKKIRGSPPHLAH
jgi:hypothetical protein